MDTGAGQRLVTGTGLDTLRHELEHTLVFDGHDTSALGEGFEAAPVVSVSVSVSVSKDFSKAIATSDEAPGSGLLARAVTATRSKYHSVTTRLRYQVSVKLCLLTEFSLCLSMDYQVRG